jgi:hypothetical protein
MMDLVAGRTAGNAWPTTGMLFATRIASKAAPDFGRVVLRRNPRCISALRD